MTFIHQDKRLQYFGLARLSPLRADSFFFREKEAKPLAAPVSDRKMERQKPKTEQLA
jgi:hypothetical protein